MRLSEAIVLGSTIVRMRPGCWDTCALGAAATAVGIPVGKGRVERILDEWPWLESNQEQAASEIVSLFDQRVCRGEMSLNELIAHVRSIEPPCDCGVRDCCCARIEQVMSEMRAEDAAVVEVEF